MGPVVAWPSGKGYCTSSSQRAWESPKVLNYKLLANFGFDTAENDPLVWGLTCLAIPPLVELPGLIGTPYRPSAPS